MAKNKPTAITAAKTESQYAIEDDARTLERFAEVKSNLRRMSAAMNHIKKKMGAMKGVLKMNGGKRIKKGKGKISF